MTDRKECSKCYKKKCLDEFAEGKFCCKNVMNIEKPIVKNIKIDTTTSREKDMKKMKSIEKGSRNKENYLKIKLFSVLLVISQ